MKITFSVLMFLSFFTSAFACVQDEISFPKNNICVEVKWIVGPTSNEFNSASFHVSDSNLKLNVIPWMVMAGGHEHGSRPVLITNVSPNDYLVEKMYFMKMMGDWFLKMQLINDKKEVVEEVRVKLAI